MYHYKCRAVRILDGDTVELSIDLGLHVAIRRMARLRGINTPELRGETLDQGQMAKARLTQLLDQAGDDLTCVTHLDRADKYGRILVELYPNENLESMTFNEILVNERLAVTYM